MIVTVDTLAKYGFNFDSDDSAIQERIDEVISIFEKDLFDAALSPELSDVFIDDVDADRFAEIRAGWIDDDHIRQRGLDYAVNYWCAYHIIQDGSFSMVDRVITTSTSENSVRLDDSFVNTVFNKASEASAAVSCKVGDDDDFEEFTEAQWLGTRSNFNF